MTRRRGAGPRVRRAVARVVSAVLGAALVTLLATPAQATGYRYWSFWERGQDGSWSYATQGPSVLRPSDGSVLGFRFAVSENSADAAKPRGPADFDAICGDTAPEKGTKRIALSIDFGTAEDAPAGERPPQGRTACARVDEDATAAEALAATAEPLRYDSSALLCAIAGYPEKGCGEQVAADGSGDGPAQAEPEAGAEASGDEGSGTVVGVAAGVGVVVALAAAAAWQARRRRG